MTNPILSIDRRVTSRELAVLDLLSGSEMFITRPTNVVAAQSLVARGWATQNGPDSYALTDDGSLAWEFLCELVEGI